MIQTPSHEISHWHNPYPLNQQLLQQITQLQVLSLKILLSTDVTELGKVITFEKPEES